MTTSPIRTAPKIEYPDSDGQPMADNTQRFDQEHQRAEQECQRAEQEYQRAERLLAQL